MMNKKMTRRALLRIGGCAGISVAGGGIAAGIIGTQTDLFDRLRGKTDMPLLGKSAAWTYNDQVLTLNLDLIPELAERDSALRLEANTLPEPLLIVHTADTYHVFLNRCSHADRRVDLKDGELKCTCISASTFDLTGKHKSGPAETDLTTYTVEQNGSQLVVTLG
ncbi:MAG TPA: Rieske (2Fe-2S) protein [Aggregatilineaceae bacterium]|nr:Rieske (2Fe-2S) protein [Aggregatilineaceae bacterium]